MKANLNREERLSLVSTNDNDDDNDNDQVSTIQFVATLQAAAAELREAGFTVEIPQVREIKLS